MSATISPTPVVDHPRGFLRDTIVDRNFSTQWFVYVSTALLILLPLVPILFQAFLDKPIGTPGAAFSMSAFGRLVSDPAIGTIIANTLFFATTATVIAVCIGVFAAIVVTRANLPCRSLIRELLMWPIYLPHLVLGFGWFAMYGPAGYATSAVQGLIGFQPWNLYSLLGISVVAGVAQAPLTFLYCAPAAQNASSSLEDAARSVGANPLRVIATITIPLMRPGIVSSAVINFVIAIEMLSIPLLLGGPVNIETWTTYLYHEIYSGAQPDYALIAAACFPLLIVVVALMLLQGRLLKIGSRFVTITGKSSVPKIFDLGVWRWPVFAVMATYVICGVVLIVGGVVLRSVTYILSPLVPFWELFTSSNYETIFSDEVYVRSIWNSFMVATIGGAIATLFVLALVLTANRSKFRYAKSLEFLGNVPRAIPGVIAGIGIFFALLWFPGIGWLRNTIIILAIVYTIRFMPLGIGALGPALSQISPHIDQSGRIAGGDWWSTSIALIVPILKPAILSCFIILFVRFFNEYVSAVFLVSNGNEVIGSTLLQFWYNGEDGAVAALATLQIAITFFVIYVARLILGVKPYV